MSDERQVAELLVDLHRDGYVKGYAEAMNRATEAVDELRSWAGDGEAVQRAAALAAIDALREWDHRG